MMRALGLGFASVARCALTSALLVLACSGKQDGGSTHGGSGAAAGTTTASGGAGGTLGGGGSAPGGDKTGGSGGGGGTTPSTTGGSAGTAAGADATGGSAPSSGGAGGSMASGAGGSVAGGGGTSGGTAGMAGTSGTGGAGDATGGVNAGGTAGSGGLPGAVPSPGCGTAAPDTGPLHIDVGGTMRDYILRLPDGYDESVPHRIIFAFHGMQGSADQVDKGDPPNTGLDPTGPYFGIKALSSDTIFVAGQALSGGWTNSNGRDIAYVKALLADLEGKLCIDESRILATGFSFGAIMTITVACNMPDVFRAVAPMSGSLQNGCPDGGPIAYWASHGTMDTTIDISKGEAARDEFVKRNGCSSTTMDTTPDGCVAYQGCMDGYPVNWCPFDGIHQPPPFSGPAIWAFLSQF